jgi:Tol biopolymer transport system component
VKDGDLDLYAMNLDGTKPRRLTDEVGYDGERFLAGQQTHRLPGVSSD